MLLELSEGGPYAILLPLICHNTFRATLRPPRWGQGRDTLNLRLESGAEDVTANRWEHALYVAAGGNPYELVDAAVATAAALSGEVDGPLGKLGSVGCCKHACMQMLCWVATVAALSCTARAAGM